jgi:HK97 family phage prohead protease
MDTNHIRAYSLLEVKAFDDDAREITGLATTPDPDRMGDIVEPLGAQFAAELPLLWQHRHDSPVGVVKFGKPTKQGIPFRASIAIIETEGLLKDMVDLAWQSVKAKLVRGVSIGFRALEYAFMESGGIRFTEIEIYELSLVTIPANASATIQTIKAMDTAGRRRTETCGVPLVAMPVDREAPLEGGAVKLLNTGS